MPILGYVDVDFANGAIHTPRDSHLIDGLKHFSVRRPFLPGAVLFGGSALAACWSFNDILYPGETAFLLAFAASSAAVGWFIGRLKLRSRELRSGDELSDSVWGTVAALDAKKMEIVHAIASLREARK